MSQLDRVYYGELTYIRDVLMNSKVDATNTYLDP